MKKVASIVAVIAILVGLKFYNRGSDQADVLKAMKELISEMEIHKTEGEYIDTLLDRHHPGAFDAAYTMGGRRRGAKFDHDEYIRSLFDRMIAEATQRKKTEVVKSLSEVRDTLTAASQEADKPNVRNRD